MAIDNLAETSSHRKALIGAAPNFWLHHTAHGFDLTHPAEHSTSTTAATPKLTIQTTNSPITVDPSKSALVIIDMQNFFLSPAFGRDLKSAGHRAKDQLIKCAIPAARKAGMRVVWVNWGLTEEEVRTMPPAVKRAFGFEAIPLEAEYGDGWTEAEVGVGVDKFGEEKFQGGHLVLENGKDGRMYKGLGSSCGSVVLDDREKIDAGRLLMRDTWNAALYPPLDAVYEEGKKLEKNPDVWIHKNRMSGLWGAKTDLEEFLEKEGIRTLFFTGVNTDQCVGGTLIDAFNKGYDCILLSDGAGTTSPEYAQQCLEFNAARTYGFCTSCEELAKGVENTKDI
jgi:nicotinamidase-related amidase